MVIWFTSGTKAARLEACLSDISDRMKTNMIKINQDKTELIIVSLKKQLQCISKLHYQFRWSDHRGIILCKIPWCTFRSVSWYGRRDTFSFKTMSIQYYNYVILVVFDNLLLKMPTKP